MCNIIHHVSKIRGLSNDKADKGRPKGQYILARSKESFVKFSECVEDASSDVVLNISGAERANEASAFIVGSGKIVANFDGIVPSCYEVLAHVGRIW